MGGNAGDAPVVVMQGRVHLYEGYSAQQVTFPIRVFARMGIRAVIVTNAAGGIDLGYSQGAFVLIRDHINLQGTNPLVGPNDDRFGVRFPDMTQAYSRAYREIARDEASKHKSLCTKASMSRCSARATRLPRRDRIPPPHGGQSGRHVDCRGSDRRPSHGNECAGNFVRDQYGRRNSRPISLALRSDGNRRRVKTTFEAFLRAVLPRVATLI